jgi:5-oxoprolinase (ATP-hydrolysing) subunit A
MSGSIDLNADCGESFGAWKMGQDETLLPLVSSANIACGFHAGDPQIMARTCAIAKAHGVGIGAHPSLPDLQGFGRRVMALAPAEIETLIAYQIGALQALAARAGGSVGHVKAHGALYNMAERDAETAGAIARAVAAIDQRLILVGGAGSPLASAAETAGLRFAAEGFPDRAYADDGTLLSRKLPGAVISDPDVAARRALRMAQAGEIETVGGTVLARPVQTLCIHGDEPRAAAVAQAIRAALTAAGIAIKPLAEVLAGATSPRRG